MEKEKKSLWKGIKAVFTAVVDWVATIFGMKDNSKYGRILHRVVGTAFAVVVIVWAMASLVRFGRNIYWNISRSCGFSDRYSSIYLDETFNDNLYYYADRWGDKGYLADSNGHKILKHILCINKPMEGDSLVFFSDGDKRGYFHMRDGRIVVKPIYEHAWVFSDGLAAVEVKGKVKFIDTTGQLVIDRGFAYDASDDGYVFHEGHCAVNDNTGKHMGLIDRNGDWALPPIYESIYPIDTFWLVRTSDAQAIITFGMDTLFPLTKGEFDISDTAIFATFANHTQSLYNLQGELVTANMIRCVEQLMYKTDEVVNLTITSDEYADSYNLEEPYSRKAVATCRRYEAESGWYGLMAPDGRMLTPPSYVNIEAVGKDLYLCENSYGHGVILNSKGRRVE